MTTYIVIWIIFLLLCSPGILKNASSSHGIVQIIIMALAIIVAFRYEVGTDWINYKQYYYSGIAFDKPSGKAEPIFMFIRDICYKLGFSHALFFLVNSLISLYAIYKAALLFNVRNIYITFFVYLSLFFCSLQFNIVRTGVMASCVWLAYAYKSQEKLLKAIIWIGIGIGFHYIALIFLPFLFIINKRLTTKWFVSVLGVGVLLYVIRFGSKILELFPFLALIDRVSGYVDSGEAESYGLSMGVMFNMALCVCLYFKYRKEYDDNNKYRILLNVLLLNNIIVLSINELGTIIARIGQTFNMTAIFLWPFVFSKLKKMDSRIIIGLLFIVYLGLFYYRTWADDGNSATSGDMLPYTFDLTQLLDTQE